ncbi:MAG: lysophospholipid acyltransferase family protein [Bdellovibrionales bacterium]|nr:lysophospholipid acyltransferase family protein [Bdellovibrionales bacterium]
MNASRRGHLSYLREDDPLHAQLVIGAIEWITGRAQLEALYEEALAVIDTGIPYWEAVLNKLRITPDVTGGENLKGVPKEGPLLIIANHPFGLVDGVIASQIASTLRPHFQVLVNEVLCTEKSLMKYFLPIDFRETREASRQNVEMRKEALRTLSRGEAVILFPGGGVATRRNGFGELRELPWGIFLAKLVQQSKATVLPLYFHGENSWLFHLASQIHLDLRLALFLRETRRLTGKSVSVDIRAPISYESLPRTHTKSELVQYLHDVTLQGGK